MRLDVAHALVLGLAPGHFFVENIKEARAKQRPRDVDTHEAEQDAADRQQRAAGETRLGFVDTAGEAVKHRARRDALTVEDGKRVIPRGTRMDHQRKVVEVEPDLAKILGK